MIYFRLPTDGLKNIGARVIECNMYYNEVNAMVAEMTK